MEQPHAGVPQQDETKSRYLRSRFYTCEKVWIPSTYNTLVESEIMKNISLKESVKSERVDDREPKLGKQKLIAT